MIVVVSQSGAVDGPFPDVSAAEVQALTSFQVTLTGGNGDVLDLTSGSVLLAPGTQLFASPDVTHWWKDSPAVDGSRWDGMRTAAQDHVLPVVVLGDDWATWRDRDAELFRATHPRSECLVTVTAPDASARSIGLRFVAGGDVETDPLANYFAAYSLEFTAANPFWRGEPVVYTFDVQDPTPLFPGPPFDINRASTTTGATVTNPGDEPAYPRYVVQGPATSWSVGVGDALVASDTPLLAGQSVTIDTDRSKLTVVDQDGNNVYAVLDKDTFAAIPPGADVPLSLTVTGYSSGSQVSVEFTPLYRRPW